MQIFVTSYVGDKKECQRHNVHVRLLMLQNNWELMAIARSTRGRPMIIEHPQNEDTYSLSGVWLGVDLRTDTKKINVLKRLD